MWGSSILVVDERDPRNRRIIKLTQPAAKPLTVPRVRKKYAKLCGAATVALQRPDGQLLSDDDALPATVFVVDDAPAAVPAPAPSVVDADAGLAYDESVMDRVHVGNLMRHAIELGALVAPIALNALESTLAGRSSGAASAPTCLDVGSGFGEPALTIADRGRARSVAVVGFDTHAPYVKAAQRRATAMGVPATFFQADACAADFVERARSAAAGAVGGAFGGFDLVTGTLVAPFFSSLEGGLRNLRACARPGAPLVFSIWDGNPPLEGMMAEMIVGCGLRKHKTSRDLTVAELCEVLPKCGWGGPRSAPATTAYKWDCFMDCWQWVLHHAPDGFKESASTDQLRGGRDHIRAYIRARVGPFDEPEPIALEVPITIVLAYAV